jgi:maleate cis-trans isomerase
MSRYMLAASGPAVSLPAVDAAVWACTSGSFVFGWDGASAQVDDVSSAAGVPVSNTSSAFVHTVAWLADLEESLGKPVLTANQVSVWEVCGWSARPRVVPGWGRCSRE